MADKKISWCDLPKDLLLSIAERFDTRVELNRIRAVCRQWRFSIPPPLIFDSPIFSFQINERSRCDLKLVETIVYCLQEAATGRSWFVRIRELEHGKVEIHDAFGKSLETHQMPSLEVINLLNFRISKITKLYDLTQMSPYINLKIGFGPFGSVKLASSPLNYPVVASTRFETLCGVIFRGCVIYNDKLSTFCDTNVVEFKGKLYLNMCRGDLGFVNVYDYSFVLTARIQVPGFDMPSQNIYYFVAFGGDLFLVNKANFPAGDYDSWKNGFYVDFNEIQFNSNSYFEVFKLEEEQQQWVKVTNLGDVALILCEDHSFGVSVLEFAGIERGFIYFPDSNPILPLPVNARNQICIWGFSLEEGSLYRYPDGLF